MSRHHHHIQPYDYDRFGDHSRKNRDREREARGIEYQDDSLSSINSDDESYSHNSHTTKDKKEFYNSKRGESPARPTKRGRSPAEGSYKERKPPPNTDVRLGRLESMLEELIKRGATPTEAHTSSRDSADKKSDEREGRDGKFQLNPRRHDLTTSMWINKIQEVSIQNNWSEKSTVQYMAAQMSGIIKAWYNSLASYEFTWPEWKILISKIFPDNVDFVTTLKRLVTRLKQPDESMTTYYFSKMYLIEACKITGEDAVSCLIDGLNNQEIQEQAKARSFLTPESLYSQFLTLLPTYTVDYAPVPAVESNSEPDNWFYEQQQQANSVPLDEEVGSGEQFGYENNLREETFNNFRKHQEENLNAISSKSAKPSGTVHSRLDKRFIRPQYKPHAENNLPMAAKYCSNCKVRGHLTRNCRKLKKNLLCNFEGHSDSCYLTRCFVNKLEFEAFIDTGCSTVTLQENVAKLLDLNVKPNSESITVYGGGSVAIKGTTHIDLKVDEVTARIKAIVVPDIAQEVSVVVGQNFLNQENVMVVIEGNKLKIVKKRFD